MYRLLYLKLIKCIFSYTDVSCITTVFAMSLLWLMSTATMSAEAWHGTSPPSSLPPPFNFSPDAVAMCPCPNSTSGNGTRVDSMSANAIKMQEALRDKPTVIHKIHHRLTHSRDAQGAALAVFGLMALILVAVYLSKMWRDKSSLAYMGKQAINYEQNTKKVEILVKGTRLVFASIVTLFQIASIYSRHA